MGMVNPYSRICAACALRYQRSILPKQSSTTQRSSNYLARNIAGPTNLHGWNKSYGSHNRWIPFDGYGILHTYYLYAELLHSLTTSVPRGGLDGVSGVCISTSRDSQCCFMHWPIRGGRLGWSIRPIQHHNCLVVPLQGISPMFLVSRHPCTKPRQRRTLGSLCTIIWIRLRGKCKLDTNMPRSPLRKSRLWAILRKLLHNSRFWRVGKYSYCWEPSWYGGDYR